MNFAKTLSDDRRKHPRYKYVKSMQVIVAKRVIKGFTCDLGEGGCSFIIDSMLHAGTVTVEVPEDGLVLEGKILGHQPTADAGLFRHQMQFKEPMLVAHLEEIFS